ncbi:unnamed protein product [Vitrella brassicaformis CCMP3155]|uniref:START domain-containing protein n=1 Tax=Vitrella brassicaformis (strain CCMP3155) TaxID=1169540 RepID=A0A0G4G7X7_VITBC|nr:unnamed protein product [Vitrella brassicaformis CCMP3155]|eukprot:CEM24603.1 unnamed protein product [Vitrella brassicaformis CCMP3155]
MALYHHVKSKSGSTSPQDGSSSSGSTTDSQRDSPIANGPVLAHAHACLKKSQLMFHKGLLLETQTLFMDLREYLFRQCRGSEARRVWSWVTRQRAFVMCVSRLRELREASEMMGEGGGWTEIPAGRKGIKVYYRQENDEARSVTVRVGGVVDVSYLRLLHVVTEPTLVPSWMPMVSKASLVPMKTPRGSSTLTCVYTLQMIPIVLSPREFVVDYCNTVDGSGRIWACMHSVDESSPPPDMAGRVVAAPPRGVIRGHMRKSISVVQPTAANSTYLEAISNVDVKFALPTSLQIYISKIAGLHGFLSLAKAAGFAESGSEFADRMPAKLQAAKDIQHRISRAMASGAAKGDDKGLASAPLEFPLLDLLDREVSMVSSLSSDAIESSPGSSVATQQVREAATPPHQEAKCGALRGFDMASWASKLLADWQATVRGLGGCMPSVEAARRRQMEEQALELLTDQLN